MTPKNPEDSAADLIRGNYLVHFEARTLDDIHSLGGNSEEDEKRFATAARVSEINLGLYHTFFQPWVRGLANEGYAEWLRRLHPQRLQYEMFSPANPFMRSLSPWVSSIKNNRRPISDENVLLQAQEWFSDWVAMSLDAYRDVRDHALEAVFHAVYGSPLVQALVGLKATDCGPRRKPAEDPAHRALVAQRVAELKEGIAEGGAREAVIRALLYIRMPDGIADERGFNLLCRLRKDAGSGLTLAAFKKVLRQQFFVLLLDERRAFEAIPAMLDREPDLAARMANNLRALIDVVGIRSGAAKARLEEVEMIFKADRHKRGVGRPSREQRELESIATERVRPTRSAKDA